MKKLIKPKGGGAGREGRALYYAAGSVENLADSVEDAHSAQPGETTHDVCLSSSLTPSLSSQANTDSHTVRKQHHKRTHSVCIYIRVLILLKYTQHTHIIYICLYINISQNEISGLDQK